MSTNYDKMAEEARKLFLQRDQEQMIRLWDLEHDDNALIVPWFHHMMCVKRDTGEIYDCGTTKDAARYAEGQAPVKASYSEYMVIYDLLTYAKERPRAAGVFCSIASLGGIIGAGHDANLRPAAAAAKLSGHLEKLRAACEDLGGLAVKPSKADLCYDFTVFRDFPIRFEFWEKDEDFPASIKYFLDKNALMYMHYETVWYVMLYLEERLIREVQNDPART